MLSSAERYQKIQRADKVKAEDLLLKMKEIEQVRSMRVCVREREFFFFVDCMQD